MRSKLPKGSVITEEGLVFTPADIEFYQLIANDETVVSASETIMLSKRTCEDRMYKHQKALGYRSKVALIAWMIRKKLIK